MSDQATELEEVTGDIAPVIVGEIPIRPLTMRQLSPFARHLKPILPSITPLMSEEGLGSTEILELFEQHGDDLIAAVAIGTGLDDEVVGEMHPDQFVELALAVFRVNTGFFVQRLLPKAGVQMEQLTAAMEKVGSPSDSD